MKYPKFIDQCGVLGVTAPSDGVIDPIQLNRLENATLKFFEQGYSILETENVRMSEKGISSDSKARARQLEYLFEEPLVQAIICVSGGDFLLEMLSDINLEKIAENPKWIQGYSDPTGLLYLITTKLDIATIYGDNFKTFGMEEWHSSLKNNLEILKGNIITQNNFDYYEKEDIPYVSGLEGYHLDTPVVWKSLSNKKKVFLKGRLIGGCLDILISMIGTRFDYTKDFIQRYKDDGIIWYFDNCELTSEGVIRALWQLKEAGWFQYTKGILFGRSMTNSSYYDISFEDAIHRSLKDLDIEVLWDLDIGHVKPNITLINGAIITVCYEDGKGVIDFSLE